ncbi:DASH family cryptochrome [Algoriphagus pacificus]|uniref:Cryptochrome DASH n=1 Tax=Algoriphagus pacificus TaxID=2811234 RepID=A0ABS3CDW1_9BACT|nr:DASH family cryptochrome [Algoriphagus pacificus]MBN7814351.1 DASH family cryptochrome [Algoriphagus pacificus]
MKFNRVIVWFRNDLRVRDNVTLSKAIQSGKEILPVYCFDPRMFEQTELGIPKTGLHRTRFLVEAVTDLRENLRELGAELIILEGKPEEELLQLAEKYEVEAIYFSKEVTSEERNVDNSLESAAWTKGIVTESFWQSTLYHLDDLPFPINQLPEVFTQFRKSVEKMSEVRAEIPSPLTVSYPGTEVIFSAGDIPELSQFGLEEAKQTSRSVIGLVGGERAGLRRLQSYFWDDDLLKNYKQTRNGLLGTDFSSRFSAWLALGCLSPRTIYYEVKRYEKERKKNDSTYWLIFELLWRDYFRFICKKHGDQVFHISGIKNQVDSWNRDQEQFALWCEGKTGIPFVDANMRELNQSGFMSNRGRQNVASFLVNDLGIDWTWGASYFESKLIDYDVCSNWGNWMYVAGVGNDPRENRYFNILNQAKNYDKNGDFVRAWIPELAAIKGFDIHQPEELNSSELKKMKIELGKTYPHAMIEMKKWA